MAGFGAVGGRVKVGDEIAVDFVRGYVANSEANRFLNDFLCMHRDGVKYAKYQSY